MISLKKFNLEMLSQMEKVNVKSPLNYLKINLQMFRQVLKWNYQY